MQKTDPEFFDQDSFFPAFLADMRAARGLVIMQSPYLTTRQIKRHQRDITQCIAKGVRICTIVQEPKGWARRHETFEPELINLNTAVDYLRSLGVHVSIRPLSHAKFSIIDDNISWLGSLNILSYFDTDEFMQRWINPAKVEELIVKHRLDFCESCSRVPLALLPFKNDLEKQCQFIGNWIAFRRRELGLSQSELAKLTGTFQTSISTLEQGKRNIEFHTLCRIFSVLRLQLLPVPWHLARVIYEKIDCYPPNISTQRDAPPNSQLEGGKTPINQELYLPGEDAQKETL